MDVKLERVTNDVQTIGFDVWNIEKAEYIGFFTGSVGPAGTSSGRFKQCQTTNPFEELELTVKEKS